MLTNVSMYHVQAAASLNVAILNPGPANVLAAARSDSD